MIEKKKKIYYILGEAKSGKSSLCRSICGISRRMVKKLSFLTNEEALFFIHVRSLQEANHDIANAINLIEEQNTRFVILTLRIKEGCNELPSACNYINAFEAKGWNTESIIVLGEEEIERELQRNKVLFFKKPKSIPTNRIAGQVRKSWELY